MYDLLLHLAHPGIRGLSLLPDPRPRGLGETEEDLLPTREVAQVGVEQPGGPGHHLQDIQQRHRALMET